MKKFYCVALVCLAVLLSLVCCALANPEQGGQGGDDASQGEVEEIVTKEVVVKENIADIVFFIDSSGSMWDEIQGVKDNVAAFADALEEKGVKEAHFAIIDFHDSQNKVIDFGGSHWTTDAQKVKDALAAITLGGDEHITRALNTVTSWSDFREKAYHFGFLLTDEPTYDAPPMATLIPVFQSMDIQISTITKQDLKTHYHDLFTNTGGVWIDIDRPDYYKSMLDLATWISETILISVDYRLVPTEVVPVATSSVASTVATEAGISAESIDVMRSEISSLYDVSLPHDLISRDIIETSLGIEFLTKINTIVLYSETLTSGDWGYFLFGLTLNTSPDITGLSVRNSTKFEAKADTDGFLDFIMFDTSGKKLDTITTKDVLILVYGKTEDCITPYLVKDKEKGDVRFWVKNAADFGDYATKNRESVLKTLEEKLKEFLKKFNIDSKTVEELKEKAEELLDKVTGSGGGGGGCETGLGIFGLAVLTAALGFRKSR